MPVSRSRAVWLFLAVASVAVAPAFTGCGADRASSKPAAAKPDPAASDLAVVAVRPGTSDDETWTTFLEPVVDAPVTARVDGIVREVTVREGQRVATGAVLARLEDDEQRLEVDYTGALAAQAKAEFERAEKGLASSFISRQQYDAARAKAEATHADLELAKLALARRTLRAPVSGMVWQVRAEAHRPVAATDVLFRVTDASKLKADLLLPATWLGSIKAGDLVTLTPLASPGAEAVEAHVRLVSPLVDPATGRFRVELEAPGGANSPAGQTVRASIGSGGGGEGALLPAQAYLERNGGVLSVWLVKDGAVHRTTVELGATRPDGYEVRAGLAPGDLVAARGATPPAEGARVRPRLNDNASAVAR